MYKSTNYDPAVEHSQFFNIIKDKNSDDFLDVLEGRLVEAIRAIRVWTPHKYQLGNNLPLISYRFYGTTTLYWAIATYNGIVDPFSIQQGQVIRIPAYSQIMQALSIYKNRKLKSSANTQSTVTI